MTSMLALLLEAAFALAVFSEFQFHLLQAHCSNSVFRSLKEPQSPATGTETQTHFL